MRESVVIGTGMIPFGRYPEKTLGSLAAPAVLQALDDAGIERSDVEAVWCGSAFAGMMAGQRVLAPLGMSGIRVANVENACASSATALHEAVRAIALGEIDVALVIGVEQLTKLGGGALPLNEDDPEVSQGLNMPAVYGMRAQRYMHEYGLTLEELASVSVKARKHGALNSDAQLRGETTIGEVLASRQIASPFTLFQCCPTGDGAAAIVVCAESAAKRWSSRGVKVAASELTSGRWTAGFRDMTIPEITVRGAEHALELAGMGADDINVAEVHDAFTIAELIYYEAFGFAPKGEAIHLLNSGQTSLGGRIPVNPSGGLLAKGHPVGASGAAQFVEIVRQLRGDCGPRQVEGAKTGLTHVTGGGLAGFDHGACSIHIFKV